jgi:hypothetical protein
VLPELDEAGTADLLKKARQAQAVIFVEPGTREVSRRLIDVREKLNGEFKPVAPCFHANKCGLLTPENERHWCHFFVPVPNVVYSAGAECGLYRFRLGSFRENYGDRFALAAVEFSGHGPAGTGGGSPWDGPGAGKAAPV